MPTLEERLPGLRRAIIELVDAFIESLQDATERIVVRNQEHTLGALEQLVLVREIVDDMARQQRENCEAIEAILERLTALEQRTAHAE